MSEINIVIKTLIEYGLSQAEAEIYIICLRNKGITPYEISKFTKIPRTTIYDVVMNLSLKGLLTLKQSDGFTKQQTNITAKNPAILRKLLRQKRENLFKIEDKVINIMPFLKGNFHESEDNTNLHFYSGVEGAREIYLEENREPLESDILVWSYLISDDLLGKETIQNEIKMRRENKDRSLGKIKTIIPITEWTKHCLSYQHNKDPYYLQTNEMRYIVDGMENFINRISVKNDVVRIISAEEDDVWGLKFESPSLAKSLKSMHRLMWSLSKPVTAEFVESFGKNEFYLYKNKDK